MVGPPIISGYMRPSASLFLTEARPQSRFLAPFSECLRRGFADTFR
ncbi:hypothetical protein SJ05684_b49410 (plasmid) [Sinorhizobium sojae CCBAU 05684]|uniref:Uncharacterized protein n=1 Tax=Sinorhizobium sojae CCBAU 05684 TaxID=716928 RepID=A0A249PJ09_9HYPH|nr:hypothetical protein SJ05684_b49410 [Sinorhizobium sojae CCBAU 05684]